MIQYTNIMLVCFKKRKSIYSGFTLIEVCASSVVAIAATAAAVIIYQPDKQIESSHCRVSNAYVGVLQGAVEDYITETPNARETLEQAGCSESRYAILKSAGYLNGFPEFECLAQGDYSVTIDPYGVVSTSKRQG